MALTDLTDEEKKRLTFTDLLKLQANPDYMNAPVSPNIPQTSVNNMTPQSGNIATTQGVTPFTADAGSYSPNPVLPDVPPTVNYPYASDQNRGAIGNVAQQYNTPGSIVSTIKNNAPMPDVYRGGIYAPGTVSTPEQQAYEQTQSDIGLASQISKLVPIYDNHGRKIGDKQVPDYEKQFEATQAANPLPPYIQAKYGVRTMAELKALTPVLKNEDNAAYREMLNDVRSRGLDIKEALGNTNMNIKQQQLENAKSKSTAKKDKYSAPYVDADGKTKVFNYDTGLTQEISQGAIQRPGTPNQKGGRNALGGPPGTGTGQPGGLTEGMTATNPKTGARMIVRGGKWQAL